jgi:murein DD-endopeptidase MepM/ murein hydrolase activator NlpD
MMSIERFGTSVASQVFAATYNTTTDMQLAKQWRVDIGQHEVRPVLDTVEERYDTLLSAKRDFYQTMTPFIYSGDAGEEPYYLSNAFKGKVDGKYKEWSFMHFGADYTRDAPGRIKGAPFYMTASGTVTPATMQTETGNNQAEIHYGYQFEDAFAGTGLYGRSMHLQAPSPLAQGQFYTAGTQLGTIGDTGSTGAFHAHQDFWGNIANVPASTVNLFFRQKIYKHRDYSITDIYRKRYAWDPDQLLQKRFGMYLPNQPTK